MGNEPIRHAVLLMQEGDHLRLVDTQDRAGCHRSGAAQADFLAGEAAFAENIAGSEHGNDRFFTVSRYWTLALELGARVEHGRVTPEQSTATLAQEA